MEEEKKISFSKFILVLALIAFAIQVGVSLYHYAGLVRAAIVFPYSLDYSEGPILDRTLLLAQGEGIYKDNFATPPYTVTSEPPLFMLLQAPLAALFGPAFWYGRLISFLCAVLSALFIGLTVYTLTGHWIASASAGLILLIFPSVQVWSLLNRADLLALTLSTAAIFTAVRWPARRWGIPAASALFIASIFTQQTYLLAGPLAVCVWLLMVGCRRQAVKLAGMTVGGTLLIFLLINALSGGGFFLNIILANYRPLHLQFLNSSNIEFLTNGFYLLVIIFVFLVAERTGDHTRSWPLALPYLLAAGISAAVISRLGSGINNLLELAAATSLAAGAAFAWMGRNNWVQAAVLFVLTIQGGGMAQWMRNGYDPMLTAKFSQQRELAGLYQLVSEADGVVLADEYMGLIPLAGKQLYFQPYEFKQLAYTGEWIEQPFLKSIREQRFDLVLMYQPLTRPILVTRWTPGMREAVREFYEQVDTLADVWVFRPKD